MSLHPLLLIIRMHKTSVVGWPIPKLLGEIPKGPNQSYFRGIGQGLTKLNEEIVSQKNVELLSKS